MIGLPDSLYLIINSYDSTSKELIFSVVDKKEEVLKCTITKKDGSQEIQYIPIGNMINSPVEILDNTSATVSIPNNSKINLLDVSQNTTLVFPSITGEFDTKEFTLIINNPEDYTITFPSTLINTSAISSTYGKQVIKFFGINIGDSVDWYANL